MVRGLLAVIVVLSMACSGCLESFAAQPERTPVPDPGPSPVKTPRVHIESTPDQPRAGDPVTLRLVVDGPAATIQRAVWAFADDIRLESLEVRRAFPEPGPHPLSATVHFHDGNQTTLHHEVTVLAADRPAAVAVTSPSILATLSGNHLEASFTWDRQPSSVLWEFGDGTTSTEANVSHEYRALGSFDLRLTLVSEGIAGEAHHPIEVHTLPKVPHVIVGLSDSGINPYHEIYHRPQLTSHPCTYLRDFPCDVEELPLSIGIYDTYAEAWAADEHLFRGMTQGQWFWIPKTVFVAVMCEGSTNLQGDAAAASGEVDLCLIDDTSMHGTGTTSSIMTENPDALLVFKEGNAREDVLTDGYLPIDVISYSWGSAVPLLLPVFRENYKPFFVAASGNEGAFPVILDSQKAHTSVITVGGADGASGTEPGYSSWKTMDFVSEYCRPTAQTQSISETRPSYCGTSFAAPTFAGALSRVIYELRQQSGYTGSIENGMVDPILGITKWQVREALNRTATYAPESPFAEDPELAPLIVEPYQWGWGYIARHEVPHIMACIMDAVCPERPPEVVAYMETVWAARQITSGELVS